MRVRPIGYRYDGGIELIVNFVGEEHRVSDALTFGRDADLQLDTNRHLHRLTGAFRYEGDRWWIDNLGSRLHLTLIAADGTRVNLAPGATQAVLDRGVVRVTAGRSTYEIEFELEGSADCSSTDATTDEADDGTRTVGLELELTPREIDFLATFARPIMLGLGSSLPTYVEVARMWGVSPKTLDNSLQSIKRKFRAAGLSRDPNLDALVSTAIQHSLVTRADLEWIQLDSGAPKSIAERDD